MKPLIDIEEELAKERERCAKIAEEQEIVFSSTEYATNQPMSSQGERFACKTISDLIRNLK